MHVPVYVYVCIQALCCSFYLLTLGETEKRSCPSANTVARKSRWTLWNCRHLCMRLSSNAIESSFIRNTFLSMLLTRNICWCESCLENESCQKTYSQEFLICICMKRVTKWFQIITGADQALFMNLLHAHHESMKEAASSLCPWSLPNSRSYP